MRLQVEPRMSLPDVRLERLGQQGERDRLKVGRSNGAPPPPMLDLFPALILLCGPVYSGE